MQFIHLKHPYNKAGDGPESPEVTLMAEELNKEFDDCLLERVIIHSGNYKRKTKNIINLNEVLPLKIKHIGNKGKFVFIELDKGWAIGIVMGMTGHFWTPEVTGVFRTMEGYEYDEKHNHVEFETTCGSFFLNDPRMFGHVFVYSASNKTNTFGDKLKSLGPDLLKDLPKMRQEDFNERFVKYREGKVLADVLLDQKFIAGIGNYIRAEAMYNAGIHPLKEVKKLSQNEKKKLKEELQKVAKGSYNCQKKNGLHCHFKFNIFREPHASQIRRNGRTIWYDEKKQKL